MKIVHPQAGEVEFDELKQFICEAKKNGYASGNPPIITRKGSRETEGYSYKNRDLSYLDQFEGKDGFIGSEVVYLGAIPLWGMNYSDMFRVPKDFPQDQLKPFKKEAMSFLKEMLMQIPTEMPFRGPVTQVQGISKRVGERVLTYHHDSRPTLKGLHAIREFEGSERINVTEFEHGERSYNAFYFSYQGRLLVPDSCMRE